MGETFLSIHFSLLFNSLLGKLMESKLLGKKGMNISQNVFNAICCYLIDPTLNMVQIITVMTC